MIRGVDGPTEDRSRTIEVLRLEEVVATRYGCRAVSRMSVGRGSIAEVTSRLVSLESTRDVDNGLRTGG